VPPDVGSVSVIVSPIHTCVGPDIGPGIDCTFTVAVVKQPVDSVYVIVMIPAESPVRLPVTGLIVPNIVGDALQVPPGDPSNSIALPSTHTVNVPLPLIVNGDGLTVTYLVTKQPDGIV
jgi:hypothetical protein